MFKLNNKSKKIMKALSLGIVSLGLLAGIGSFSANNAHALTAEQVFNDPALNEYNNQVNAKATKIGIEESRANARASAELDIKNTENAGFPASDAYPTLRAYPSYDMDIVNSVIREQQAKDASKNNKTKSHQARVYYHPSKHIRKLNYKKSHKKNRKAKIVKKNRNKKSARIISSFSYRNKRYVRLNKKNKRVKSHKFHKIQKKLTAKQVKHFKNLVKKYKKSLKSRKARKNHKYYKNTLKSIYRINKFLRDK